MGKRVGIRVFISALILIILSACRPLDLEVGCDVGELIQAINDANNDTEHTTIVLTDDCVYTLTSYDNQTDKEGNPTIKSGNTGLPVITTPITIEGNHAIIARSNNAPEMRFFLIDTTGILTLRDMTLDNGLVQTGVINYRLGGAVLNRGRFNLVRSEIINSYAEDSGGAIDNEGPGTMDLIMGSLRDNSAGKDGGAILNEGSLVIRQGSRIENNVSLERGGGIMNTGSLDISQSRLLNNEANEIGGAILSLFPSIITLDDVVFESNQTKSHGGAIYFNNSTFSINNCIFSSNVGDSGGGMVIESSSGILEETTFSDNVATVFGGGIWILNDSDVTINLTTFSNNHSGGSGGGLYNVNETAGVVITNSIFENNETYYYGGGISNLGRITVRNTTITGNLSHRGGGIHNWGERFKLVNSTVSGNSAQIRGGGLSNSGSMNILFSTIAFNQSDYGGGVYHNGDSLKIKNSLFSDNTSTNCTLFGTLTALGDNIDDDGSCQGFSLTANPFLGPLADNGGPTQTHAFLFTSPAQDGAADCTNTSGGAVIANDQRGEPRPYNIQCDLGAYEAQFTGSFFNILIDVSFDRLQCLSGPSDLFGQIALYYQGDSLTALGRNEAGTWVGIAGMDGQSDEVACWVPSEGVESPEPIISFPILESLAHPPEPGLDDDEYNRCALFAPDTYSLFLLDIPPGTGELTTYLKMPEGVHGLEVLYPEDPDQWVYSALLGKYQDPDCTFDGYAGQLYCRFDVPESYFGTVRKIEFSVLGCVDPFFTHDRVTIPDPTPPLSCTSSLNEPDCNAAGGSYSCGVSSACECICP